MGARYLIDTSVISKYFNEELSDKALTLLDSVIENEIPQMSIITRIELKVYKPALATRESQIQSFIDGSEIYGLTEPTILQTV